MGMLERYKKTGGFVQLLSLIETCGPQKKEKFLAMIKEENSAWENALRQKVLTVEKIMSWPPAALAEVTSRCQILSLTGVYLSADSKQQELIYKSCPFGVQKKIKDMIDTKKFTPAEISTSVEKFLTETRALITQNILKMDKIDPSMEIFDDMEEKLNTYQILNSVSPAPTSINNLESNIGDHNSLYSNINLQMSAKPSVTSEEVSSLKIKIHQLMAENSELKQEISIYRDKLERIKKIA